MLNSFQRTMVIFGFLSCLVFLFFPLYKAYEEKRPPEKVATLH